MGLVGLGSQVGKQGARHNRLKLHGHAIARRLEWAEESQHNLHDFTALNCNTAAYFGTVVTIVSRTRRIICDWRTSQYRAITGVHAAMNSKHAHYKSYLLRLWREVPRGPWRVSLQSTATEHTVHFVDIGLLFAFMEEQLLDPPAEDLSKPHLPHDEA